MHLNNKTVFHRGVDFTNQRGGGLILNWDSTSSTTAAYQIEGGDLCVLHKKAGDTYARMINMKEYVVSIQSGAATDADFANLADKLYICYQGAEESESSLFANKDLFVKMKDAYLTFELKDLNATNYGEIAIGDNLVTVATSGVLGTSSMTSAPFNVANRRLFPNIDDSGTISASKDMVVAKATDTDVDGNTVYTVTVVV